MSGHFSKSLLEQYRDRSLDISILADISAHLEFCAECYELFHEVFRDKKLNVPAWFSLSSKGWLRDEHLEYEQLVSYVDGRLAAEDLEWLNEHLELCGRCQEDVRSFVAHRQQIEPELEIRYAPAKTEAAGRHFPGRYFMDWRQIFKIPLKPAYAVYALLLIGAVVAATVLLKRGGSIERPSHSATPIANVSPTSNPNVISTPIANTIASQSSGGPDKSGVEPGDRRPPYPKAPTGTEATNWRDSERPVVSLRDGGRQISLDDTGNLAGLEDLPASTRQIVKEALSSGDLRRPAILDDLTVEKSVARSVTVDQPSFKLISPGQAVLVDDKPVFKWEPLKGAIGYKVYIASKAKWAGISSPALSASTFEWTPPAPLRRGEIYTWVVSAMMEKGELTAPNSSEPERRFRVLGKQDYSALTRLRQRTDSHLALGLFYARLGLISEAERELQLLAEENADSSLAGKLLDQTRSWR